MKENNTTKDQKTAVPAGQSESPCYTVIEPFDDVELVEHTSAYRAYSLPPGHPRGPFLFVCLYADEIRYFDEVEIKRKLPAGDYDPAHQPGCFDGGV